MLECSLRLLLHYLKDGTVHIPPNHYLSAAESYMSKAYPSNLLRPQYDILSDLIPEPKSGGRPREVEMWARDLLCSV